MFSLQLCKELVSQVLQYDLQLDIAQRDIMLNYRLVSRRHMSMYYSQLRIYGMHQMTPIGLIKPDPLITNTAIKQKQSNVHVQM